MTASWQRWLGKLKRLSVLVPYVPSLLVSSVLAYKAIGAVLDRAGHAAVPLDDAFIHFQYARNLASGHFFTYAPGDGFTAGATSLLWPSLLAGFHLIGFRDLSIIWVTWFFGFLAHAALTVEAYRLSSRLTGKQVALGVGAMTALFGGFIWFAASGMETVPLAWALMRTARVASDWCELPHAERSRARAYELLALGLLTPLVRPEGALASLFALVALVRFPAPTSQSRLPPWSLGLVPLLGPLVSPTLNWIMTGASASNTMTVKWLPLSPYYASVGSLWGPVRDNLGVFFGTLLNGEQWSAVFVPKGSLPFALAALVAVPLVGWRSRRPWRASFALALALGILVTCTYGTFLWNRLRYLWPFVPAWFVGVGCLAKLIGDAAAHLRPRWAAIGPVLSAIAAGTLLANLSWSVDDLAKSAAAIDQQQVSLGIWARDNLPSDAVIGVNDTGAIAYVSERKTFDVVGLTTSGEAPYWVAGAGSRFEHYERLVESNPRQFPSHFIVYRHWMNCDSVLGDSLHSSSVYDQSILGGTTMEVLPARRDLLGSGSVPVERPLALSTIDEVDVADLESEKAHGYEAGEGTGLDTSNKVFSYVFPTEDGLVEWADGGRSYRTVDRFVVGLTPGAAARGIARWVGPDGGATELIVDVDGATVATLRIEQGQTVEHEFVIPAQMARERTVVEVRSLGGRTFASLHYWFEPHQDPSGRKP